MTDRCNFRCISWPELLIVDETTGLAGLFVARGVRKISLTGGSGQERVFGTEALARHAE